MLTTDLYNNLFGPIDDIVLNTEMSNVTMNHSFAEPKFIDNGDSFAQYNLNLYHDTNNVLFTATMHATNETNFHLPISNYRANFKDIFSRAFINRNYTLVKNKLKVGTGVSDTLYTIQLNTGGATNLTFKDFALGLTLVELNALKALRVANNLTKTYLKLTEIGNGDSDIYHIQCYYKFKVELVGLNANRVKTTIAPNTPIEVYAHSDRQVFTSKNFVGFIPESTSYNRDYEEAFGNGFEDTIIDIVPAIKTEVDGFIMDISAIAETNTMYSQFVAKITQRGRALWNAAKVAVQAQMNATTDQKPDDRPLYWARIKMAVKLKEKLLALGYEIDGGLAQNLIHILEQATRNYAYIDFTAAPPGAKKILITGFDPFQLNYNKNQQNPSGIAALSLSDKTLEDAAGKKAYIQVAIFPVRYPDFDNGVVEELVKPFLATNSINMIMSLSLNGDAYYFDLERFAGKKRGGFPDNLNIGTNIGLFKEDIGDGNEFYETTLPVANIVTPEVAENFDISKQRFFYDQSYYRSGEEVIHFSLKNSTSINTNINSFPISSLTGFSVEGSGSDYLSNEIFYRIARCRTKYASTVKTGHLHIANSNPQLNLKHKNQLYTEFTMIESITEVSKTIKRCINYI